MKKTLVLTGSMAGKTILLNGRKFVNGRLELMGPDNELAGLERYFGRCYSACVEGSEEHKAVLAAGNGNGNGTGKANGDPGGGGSEAVSGDLQSDGTGSSAPSAEKQPGDDGGSSGSEGGVPDGNGHPNSGVRPESESDQSRSNLSGALGRLSPENDDHWTQAGLPQVSIVAGLAGENVSRAMIDEMFPNFDREKFGSDAEAALAP